MTNTKRAEMIRVELARKGLTHGDVATCIGKDRQSVSRIALSGKPGIGCEIRQALSKLVGTPCGVFWGCGNGEEVDLEEVGGTGNNDEHQKEEMGVNG